MDTCQDCGKPIKTEDKFCPECGHDLKLNGLSTGKKNLGRDILIIAASLLIVATGYILFPSGPVVKSTGFDHPDIAGMNMGNSPDIEKIMAELPEDYDELVKLGNDYMDHGIYALAIECYQRAVDINADDPNVLVDLGACRYGVGENENAIRSFEKALTINPNHVIAHFNMGIVYRGLGNKEKAVQHWIKVTELQPGTPLADTANYYIANFKLE